MRMDARMDMRRDAPEAPFEGPRERAPEPPDVSRGNHTTGGKLTAEARVVGRVLSRDWSFGAQVTLQRYLALSWLADVVDRLWGWL